MPFAVMQRVVWVHQRQLGYLFLTLCILMLYAANVLQKSNQPIEATASETFWYSA